MNQLIDRLSPGFGSNAYTLCINSRGRGTWDIIEEPREEGGNNLGEHSVIMILLAWQREYDSQLIVVYLLENLYFTYVMYTDERL